jgi:mono/diheme cytochrome c family protein
MKKVTRVLVAAIVLGAGASSAADLGTAKESYTTFCVKCHGVSGKGDGASGATLKTKPRDFTDCDHMAKMSDDLIFKTIKEGGEAAGLSKDMPVWKEGFDDEEIRGLAAFVRTFCKK